MIYNENINDYTTGISGNVSKDNTGEINITNKLNKPNTLDLTLDSTITENMKDLKFLPYIKKFSLIAFPGMMFYLFIILLQVVNLAFIGQKYNDEDMIKGIGISNLYMNCTMFAIVQGLVSGIDTLCSNAYGVKKYKLMGLYLHRARILAYIATVIIVIVHIFTVESVLTLFNLNENVINYSKKYIYVCLIYVFFDVQTACNFRFLNVIRKAHVNFVILVIGAVFHPLWAWIFINYLDMGVVGAGISFTISRLIIALCGTIYMHIWNPLPESYFCINKACFKGLWQYCKFSFAAAFLLCAEWWAFEIQAIIAITISEDDYIVHILISQFSSLLFSVGIGFSFAATILVGSYIANSTIKITKKACYYGLGFSIFTMAFFVAGFYLARNFMLSLFIDKSSLINKGAEVIPVLCLCEMFDVAQIVMSAFFKGLGKQVSASILTFIQFYVIMTSLSYYLGNYLGYGVWGMWVGICIGYATAFLFYIIMFFSFDFKKIQQETKQRLDRDAFNAKSFIEISEKETYPEDLMTNGKCLDDSFNNKNGIDFTPNFKLLKNEN